MAEDREKEEIRICVLHVSFIITHCIFANRFSKVIAPVETKKTGNSDTMCRLITVQLTHCLNKRQFIVRLSVGFFFNSINLKQSYFPKRPTVMSETDRHMLKHSPVTKYKVQICIYRTTGLVNVNFTVLYVEVKHYPLLAPIF